MNAICKRAFDRGETLRKAAEDAEKSLTTESTEEHRVGLESTSA